MRCEAIKKIEEENSSLLKRVKALEGVKCKPWVTVGDDRVDTKDCEPNPPKEYDPDVVAHIQKFFHEGGQVGEADWLTYDFCAEFHCGGCPFENVSCEKSDIPHTNKAFQSYLDSIGFPWWTPNTVPDPAPEPKIIPKEIEYDAYHKADGTVDVSITKQTHREGGFGDPLFDDTGSHLSGDRFCPEKGRPIRSFLYPESRKTDFCVRGQDRDLDNLVFLMIASRFCEWARTVAEYNVYFSVEKIRERLAKK